MKYNNIEEGRFRARPNRFIAEVEIRGKIEICHVKNTGRCKELLIPGVTIYTQRNHNPDRKTKLDLISVYKGQELINMDSQVPNKIVREWIEKGKLFQNITLIKPESTYGNSRFDLYIEADNKKIYMEVKGVTLEEHQVAMFPDAPTLRGVKHVEELCKCREEGYEAYVFFVIQMKGITYFIPNKRTHPEFSEALKEARRKGVHLLAYDCIVTRDSIEIDKEIPIRL
jgi:A/G-specific adenine glycosylase